MLAGAAQLPCKCDGAANSTRVSPDAAAACVAELRAQLQAQPQAQDEAPIERTVQFYVDSQLYNILYQPNQMANPWEVAMRFCHARSIRWSSCIQVHAYVALAPPPPRLGFPTWIAPRRINSIPTTPVTASPPRWAS